MEVGMLLTDIVLVLYLPNKEKCYLRLNFQYFRDQFIAWLSQVLEDISAKEGSFLLFVTLINNFPKYFFFIKISGWKSRLFLGYIPFCSFSDFIFSWSNVAWRRVGHILLYVPRVEQIN